MPPTSPLRSVGAPSSEAPWYVMQQSNEIWLEQSATRPDPKVDRGIKHIVVYFGPGSREQAIKMGDRFVTSSGAVWRGETPR